MIAVLFWIILINRQVGERLTQSAHPILCRSFVDHAIKKIAQAADNDLEINNFEGYAGIYLPPVSLAEARAEATVRKKHKFCMGEFNFCIRWKPGENVMVPFRFTKSNIESIEVACFFNLRPSSPPFQKQVLNHMVQKIRPENVHKMVSGRGWTKISRFGGRFDKNDHSLRYNIFKVSILYQYITDIKRYIEVEDVDEIKTTLD